MPQDFFHTNLRQARIRAGYSQQGLADAIGVSLSVIGSLERGATNLFSKHIPAIARTLNVSEEELLCGVPSEVLLHELPHRREQEEALIREYEEKMTALRERLAASNRLVEVLQANVDSLSQSNQYLMEQLRKND